MIRKKSTELTELIRIEPKTKNVIPSLGIFLCLLLFKMKTRRTQLTTIGRLLKRADFLRVQGTGKKWVTPTCIVQMANAKGGTDPTKAGIRSHNILTPHPTPTMSGSASPARGEVLLPCIAVSSGDDTSSSSPFICRYGLTITKKIWKHAVDRNRVRRRVRGVFLGILARFIAEGRMPPGTDFVLLPRTPALTAPIETIEKDLKWAMKRLIEGKNGS